MINAKLYNIKNRALVLVSEIIEFYYVQNSWYVCVCYTCTVHG